MESNQEFGHDFDGVEDGDSDYTESTATTATEAEQGQPNGTDRRLIESEKTKRRINLDEYPEFREYRSKTDQRMAEMERRYQQQLQKQAAELRNRQMAEMDDYERLQYELQEERQARVYAEQQREEYAAQSRKQQLLEEISKDLDVPVSVMWEARDPIEATRLARQYIKESEQRRAKEQADAQLARQRAKEEKAQRNTVNTGSGAPLPPSSDWDRQYQQFQQKKDPWSMFTHALNTTQE